MEGQQSNNVTVDLSDGVMHVLFNRPERKNALTNEMYQAISTALETAEAQVEVKVVLFSGVGGSFTAGNDLDGFIEQPPKTLDAPVFSFLQRLSVFPKPVVAAVEGLAIGIGTTMLLHSDLVYAAEGTRFALPFVTLGLVPEAASSLLLPQLCGHQRAAEKLMFGEAFSAEDAFNLGFVNLLLPASDVFSHAMAKAKALARLPGGSLRDTKALMKAPTRSAVGVQLQHEVERFARRLDGAALREAVEAFKSKRRPDFTGMD